PSLVSHDARIAPSSTREKHSPGAAPAALKFYDMGPYIVAQKKSDVPIADTSLFLSFMGS
ncbi:MAG: hypothetical protein NC403_02445, partial [Muribaculaceae bacterium]|nr:hypothetical protein [Muribaculaceae bacterium]